MPSRDYYESVWEGVPAGAEPSDARLRGSFLLEHVLAERERGELRGRDAPMRALDVGCGAGYFAELFHESGVEVVAVDVAQEALRRARSRHPELDARLVDPDAPLPLEDSSFDVVWVGETIEHVHDTAAFLYELRRVLRSGGLLLLSTPDHGPLLMLWLALSPSRFARHFDPRSDHLRFYARRALADLLDDFGFEDVVVRGAGGLPGARRVLLDAARRRRF